MMACTLFWALATIVGLQLGLLCPSGLALQCYSWRYNDRPEEAVNASCDGDCVTVTMEGWNIITRQELSLSMGMCDTDECNTTCENALKTVRNFDLKDCKAKCCSKDFCNAFSSSLNPTEQRMRTEGKPRITKKTVRDTSKNPEVEFTGLKCYKCKEGTDYYDCLHMPSIDNCGPEHNSCFSVTGTLSHQPDEVVTHRGCGLEAIDCNVTQLCIDTRDKLFVNHELDMITCNAFCCQGQFCNSYIPTRPAAEVKTMSASTRARRTAKRYQAPSMKCYECKPDTFDSMCQTNDTEQSCVAGSQGYDGCFTMTATIANATSGELVDSGEWKGCAVRDDDCNETSSRCDTLAGILNRRGLQLKSCLVNCCQGDLCNSFLPTARPNVSAYAVSQAQVGCTVFKPSLVLTIIVMVSHWLSG